MAGKSIGRVCKEDLVSGVPLLTPLVPNVTIGGFPIAVHGTAVTPHGKFPHSSATMISTNPTVTAGGIPVCTTGDVATCGDSLIATSNVFI